MNSSILILIEDIADNFLKYIPVLVEISSESSLKKASVFEYSGAG
jgi:hypothetical protein